MELIKETIVSGQNKYVGLVRGLSNKKTRESEARFRFDGVKLMCEAVKRGVELDLILVSEGQRERVFEKAEALYGIGENDITCRVMTVADHIFQRISEENAPEGVICVAKYMSSVHRHIPADERISPLKGERILLLESVRDPQNVGAIVRVASAFGVDRMILSADCADIYNSKTLRASMGAVFAERIDMVEDIASAIRELVASGRRVFAAALDNKAQSLGGFDISEGDCVLIGNEGHGLTREAMDACGNTVFIPMGEGVESLNAATAAAVLVWEFFGSPRNARAGDDLNGNTKVEER